MLRRGSWYLAHTKQTVCLSRVVRNDSAYGCWTFNMTVVTVLSETANFPKAAKAALNSISTVSTVCTSRFSLPP